MLEVVGMWRLRGWRPPASRGCDIHSAIPSISWNVLRSYCNTPTPVGVRLSRGDTARFSDSCPVRTGRRVDGEGQLHRAPPSLRLSLIFSARSSTRLVLRLLQAYSRQTPMALASASPLPFLVSTTSSLSFLVPVCPSSSVSISPRHAWASSLRVRPRATTPLGYLFSASLSRAGIRQTGDR